MKKLLCVPVLLLLVLAFTVPAAADEGVDIGVRNEQAPVGVRLVVWSDSGGQEFDRSAGKAQWVRFSKSETAHDPKAINPRWLVMFNGKDKKYCKYTIDPGQNSQLAVTPQDDCAKVQIAGRTVLFFVDY
jgi:hypothetical protein